MPAGDGDVPDLPFEGNAISALVDGAEIKHTNVILVPDNTGGGRLMLDAVSADYLQRWRVFVPGTPGTYECDDEGSVTVLQLVDGANFANNGVGSGEGSCTIKLISAADGVVYGTFEASLETTTAGTFKQVTSGVFYRGN